MRARDDDGPDAGPSQAAKLGGDALDGASWLGVGIEEIPGDQEDVHFFADRQFHGRPEGGELALAQHGRPFPQVRVPRPQVDVGRV